MYQSAGSFAVDSAEINRHSADVANISSQIQEGMATMRGKLEALQGTWKGQAALQYAELHREWEATQEQVRHSLDDISRTLASAGQVYAQTEQDVRAAFTAR